MTRTAVSFISIAARALIVALFAILNTGCPSGCNLPPDGGPRVPKAEVVFECSAQVQTTLVDSFVGALVVDNTDVVSNPQLTLDGPPIPINSNLDDVVSGIIRDALIRKGVFDPQTQYLLFFQTSNAITIFPTDSFRISYTLKRADGSLVINGRTGGGGTSASLLKPGISPDDFFAFQVPVNPTSITVPTLSEWGLISMALLLMTTSVLFIVRRQPRRYV